MMDGANWYIYCAGNPVMFIDPSGFEIIVYPNGKMVDRASGSELWNSHINGQTPRADIVIREATPVKREPSLLESIAVNSSAASSTNGGPQITAARHTWNFEAFEGRASLQAYNENFVKKLKKSYLSGVREDDRGYTIFDLQSEVNFKGTTTFESYSLYTKKMTKQQWESSSYYQDAKYAYAVEQGLKDVLDYIDFTASSLNIPIRVKGKKINDALTITSFAYNPSNPAAVNMVEAFGKNQMMVMYAIERQMVYDSNSNDVRLLSYGAVKQYDPFE